MHTDRWVPVKTPYVAVTGALALSLVLAGCSGGGEEPKAAPAADSTASSGTERSKGDSGTSGALPVNHDVEAVDFGEPQAVTGPGTALALGAPAWLNQTYTGADGAEATGGVGVSVLGIQKLDPKLFDQFSNAEEFEGYTPFGVIVQHQWLYEIPADTTPETIDLFPLGRDGADVQYLTSGFAFSGPGDSCGLQLPDYDEENQIAVSCFVALGESEPVTAAEYNGESYTSFMASADNAYFPAPVVWQ